MYTEETARGKTSAVSFYMPRGEFRLRVRGGVPHNGDSHT